jgi:hypothetical protein
MIVSWLGKGGGFIDMKGWGQLFNFWLKNLVSCGHVNWTKDANCCAIKPGDNATFYWIAINYFAHAL